MREHFHPELQTEKYVVFVNDARRYVDCTDDVCDLLGYTRAEILSMGIDSLSYNNSYVQALFEKYTREGVQSGEYILRHKSGAPILIHYVAWVFSDGCNAAAWKPAEEWEQLYLAALIETQPGQHENKVNLALSAIQKREAAMDLGNGPDVRDKLSKARETLRSLLT